MSKAASSQKDPVFRDYASNTLERAEAISSLLATLSRQRKECVAPMKLAVDFGSRSQRPTSEPQS